jgi:transposase
MNIIDAFGQLGSYRAAARLCGTTDKTVKRAVQRQQAGGPWGRRPRLLSKNTDTVMSVIWERVRETDGRISAKRLLPRVRAAGYEGSARNFRRAVAKVKREWRQKRRLYRPWVPTPGQHLVADWTKLAMGLHMFCAVLAWSRYRFIRFAADETRDTTLGLLAECCEELGAVPAVVLTDRMGCLKNGVVANVVVPHPECPLRRALRISPRLLRGGRPGVERRGRTPLRVCATRPGHPGGSLRWQPGRSQSPSQTVGAGGEWTGA